MTVEKNAAIVDDDGEQRLIYREFLEELGFRVDDVGSVAELSRPEYVLALVDMVFKDQENARERVDGPEFCSQLRRKFPRCLIIAMSSVADQDVLKDAVTTGACAMFRKEDVRLRTLREYLRLHWCCWHPDDPDGQLAFHRRMHEAVFGTVR